MDKETEWLKIDLEILEKRISAFSDAVSAYTTQGATRINVDRVYSTGLTFIHAASGSINEFGNDNILSDAIEKILNDVDAKLDLEADGSKVLAALARSLRQLRSDLDGPVRSC